MKFFSLKLFNGFALAAGLCACGGNDTAGGISEENEGVVALTNKKIEGVTQKGPFVKDSKITLKETKADGSIEPTGNKFTTKTLSNKGDFQFKDLDLESQFVLLSAKGRYVSEYDGEPSTCPITLKAVSDLEKRETVNINLLTHFEYDRVLNLVKDGKNFVDAKKQAATEVLDAFGIEVKPSSAEDLNIYNTSDADRVLFNLSLLIDSRPSWDYLHDEDEECVEQQNFIDSFRNDFADDGKLSDSIMQNIAGGAYILSQWYAEMELVDEKSIEEKAKADPDEKDGLGLASKKSEYDFSKQLFLHYMNVEACTDELWGNYKKFKKAIQVDNEIVKSGYLLCNGYFWEITTKEHIDSLTLKIDHKTGTMTDNRDGKKYKTVSFKYKGKKYEWMAENLQYTDSTVKYSKGSDKNKRLIGSYTWTTAMQLDKKYMKQPTGDGVLDSLHQGVCPSGWHVSTSAEWTALINYVDGPGNLLNEKWKSTSKRAALTKDLFGVFHNKFDFNLTPMDPVYLQTYYHTYSLDPEILSLKPAAQESDDDDYKEDYDYDMTRNYFDSQYRLEDPNFVTINFSINDGYVSKRERRKEGYVRCVKN